VRVLCIVFLLGCHHPVVIDRSDAGDASEETGACCSPDIGNACCASGGGWNPYSTGFDDGCPIVQSCGHPWTLAHDDHGCAYVVTDFNKTCDMDSGKD
jgi:hypothetical protein